MSDTPRTHTENTHRMRRKFHEGDRVDFVDMIVDRYEGKTLSVEEVFAVAETFCDAEDIMPEGIEYELAVESAVDTLRELLRYP